jgi:hypothetical protein
VPAGHHPHHQRADAAKAGHKNKQDDLQLMITLVARQMREQQLARASYKIFGHGVKIVFLVAVAPCNLYATIGSADSCCLFPEKDSNEIHCGGSESAKPVEIKWVSTERRLTAFSKLGSHRIANTQRVERMKRTLVTEQNGQQHGCDRMLMPALFRVLVHYIRLHQCLGYLHDKITSGALATIEGISGFECLGSLQNRACDLDMMGGR